MQTTLHPGKVLEAEFLVPFAISPLQLASATGIPYSTIQRITRCEERLTADIALRLSRYFNNTARFWLRLQNTWDLDLAAQESVLDGIPTFGYHAA